MQEPIQQTHKDSSLFKVLPKNSDTLTVIEKSDRRDSVTSAVSQESEMESKISSDLMSKVSSDHISKAGSDDVGQEIEQKQQQQRGKAPSQQLTEPKKPVTLVSRDSLKALVRLNERLNDFMVYHVRMVSAKSGNSGNSGESQGNELCVKDQGKIREFGYIWRQSGKYQGQYLFFLQSIDFLIF